MQRRKTCSFIQLIQFLHLRVDDRPLSSEELHRIQIERDSIYLCHIYLHSSPACKSITCCSESFYSALCVAFVCGNYRAWPITESRVLLVVTGLLFVCLFKSSTSSFNQVSCWSASKIYLEFICCLDV